MDRVLTAIEDCAKPTIAAVAGACTGGGLAIAAACDFRVATPDAHFGIPIARTLGNCLSMANTARIVAAFGPGRAKRLLMLADLLDAEEARLCGFVAEIAEPGALDERVGVLVSKLSSNAPVTMRVMKEGIRRVLGAHLPDGADLVAEAYGSRDFAGGVEAFLAKRKPAWTGS